MRPRSARGQASTLVKWPREGRREGEGWFCHPPSYFPQKIIMRSFVKVTKNNRMNITSVLNHILPLFPVSHITFCADGHRNVQLLLSFWVRIIKIGALLSVICFYYNENSQNYSQVTGLFNFQKRKVQGKMTYSSCKCVLFSSETSRAMQEGRAVSAMKWRFWFKINK